ncbi:histone deacetylase 4-like [Tropilaelaps mercedesae]|uniref:Histone deacetylase 4-like n=1 Tax=Tropilaelaps mercedesae TaxID=418985 RepID=A0A1V9XEF9_9ACAR|nr:histone deacetylase 4-like [Tropilaelaps mercedesae]
MESYPIRFHWLNVFVLSSTDLPGKSNGAVRVPSAAGPVEILKRPSWGPAEVDVTGVGGVLTPVPPATPNSSGPNASMQNRQISGPGGGPVAGGGASLSRGPTVGAFGAPRSLPMDHTPSSNSNSPPMMQPIMPLIQENEAVLTVSSSGGDTPRSPSGAAVVGAGGVVAAGGAVTAGGKVVVPLLEFQQQLVAMKQEQQLQQQLLLQSFRHQQRQLAQQHEMQLQERVRVSQIFPLKAAIC